MPLGDVSAQDEQGYGEVTARQVDQNGYVTIERNPITRVGVFPYSGRNLPGADPERVYNVYRPEEEVCSPEALESFKLLPLTDEHVMLGEGFTPVESITTHGTSGENVVAENGVVYAPLRIFSGALNRVIDAAKKGIEGGKDGLSVGYRCVYEKVSGIWQGKSYDYIQRKIRGNHIALVQEGRMGKDIAVLDQWAFDSFDLNKQELSKMAEPEKKDEAKKEGNDAGLTLEQVHAWATSNMPMYKELAAMMGAEGAGTKAEGDADTKEKEGEQKEGDEKADKKAEDAAACAKQAMDSVSELNKKFADLPKAIRAEIRKADDLAKQLFPVVGTFDHAEMSAHDVAVYGCEKLGLKPAKGTEEAVLGGYLAGAKTAASKVGFAQDGASISPNKPKAGGLLDKTLAQHA